MHAATLEGQSASRSGPFFWLDFAIPAAFALNTVFPVGNLDIWFHLKTGELVYKMSHIPRTDPFSFTAFGNPWINHEWLFGVGAYLLYSASGITGLILAKAAVACAVLLLVLLTVRRYAVSPLLEAEILMLTAIAIFPRVYVRPHIFTFLFTAYLVWRLDAFRRRDSSALWEIPLLCVLWSNIHGGVVFGLGVLGLVTLGELVDFLGRRRGEGRPAGRLSTRRMRHLGLITALSALGTMANPFTYHLHVFIVKHLYLGEVVKIAEHVSVFGLGFTIYWIVAGVSAFALVRLWPNRRWAEILLVLVFGLFSMKSHRTTPVFAIVAAPIIARGLKVQQPISGKEVKRKVASLVAAAVLLALALGGQMFPDYYQRSGVPPVGLGLYEPRYPIGAVAFVEEHNLTGPMYNEYDFGGYLIWKWYPERKVFQDGRTLVYDKEFYRKVYGTETAEEWNGLMEAYGVELALVSSQLEANFTKKFVEDRWALLYWDEVAAVMLKRLPAHEQLIGRYEYRLLEPFLTGAEVEAIVERAEGEKLAGEIRRHLETSPRNPRSLALSGWRLLADERPADALQAFEESLEINPYLFQANLGAARSLSSLGREDEAKKHWKRLLRLGAEGSIAEEARHGTGGL